MPTKNVLVIKNSKVVNVIVVNDSDEIDPKEHGGDYFLSDQTERPGIGWNYTKTNSFGNPNGEERIEDNIRITATPQEMING